MELFGAKFEEVVGVMNAVATDANEFNSWRKQGDFRIADGSISGISVRLRQRFINEVMTSMSISGNGWMVNFMVNRRLPLSLPKDEFSATVNIEHSRIKNSTNRKLCLHSATVVSPEEFRREMTLLRMFSSEWEL